MHPSGVWMRTARVSEKGPELDLPSSFITVLVHFKQTRGLYLAGSENRPSLMTPNGAGFYKDIFEETILGLQGHAGRHHARLQPLEQARGRRIPAAQGRLTQRGSGGGGLQLTDSIQT